MLDEEDDFIVMGDKVTIIHYGNMVLTLNDEGGLSPEDSMPFLVGQIGTVDKIIGKSYYIRGLFSKYGPYNKEQLKKLS